MEIIMWAYLLFAFTTAIVSVYELYYPVLDIFRLSHPENNVSENFKLSLFIFALITLVVAPFVFPACIIPSMGARFRDSIYTALTK